MTPGRDPGRAPHSLVVPDRRPPGGIASTLPRGTVGPDHVSSSTPRLCAQESVKLQPIWFQLVIGPSVLSTMIARSSRGALSNMGES